MKGMLCAIDPGNDSAGIAWHDYRFPPSDSIYKHMTIEKLAPPVGPRIAVDVCIIEVPQNGTHVSRGGVMFAAGVLYGRWVEPGTRILFVRPDEWRRALFGTVKDEDWKKKVMDFVMRSGYSISSHDEADAIAILLAAEKMPDRKTRYVQRI